MNAPQERGNQEFMNVQNLVFENQIMKEGITSDQLVEFILSNAPFFRFFAEHLPDYLRKVWINAQNDAASQAQLVEAYDEFYVHIGTFVKTYISELDPEAMTELSNAVDNGNTTIVSNLIEQWVAMQKRTEERIEE